jgi:hypothetical protein
MEQRRTSLMVRTSERVPRYVRRTVTLPDQPSAELALLLFNCAKTVSESHLFQPPGLLFERKQIPQIVVIVRIQRKTMEPLEQTTVPWAQGVGRSNRPDPTKRFKILE